MSDSIILRTENVSRQFGGLGALTDVSVDIEEGKIHSIIGPNGAGKTTFFNVLSGRIPPSSGKVFFSSRPITGLPQYKVARLGIARSYQITTIFPKLKVLDNLMVAGQSGKAFNFWRPSSSFKEDVDGSMELLQTVGLEQKADLLASHLSHGEQRYLDIAIALRTAPKLLLLDEPTAGMSPVETEETVKIIRRLAEKLTVVLVEHKMEMIMKISERITVLHFGQVLAEGTPVEIQANAEVQRAYLGAGRDKEELEHPA